MIPLIGPDFNGQTPENFYAYCKALIQRKASVSGEVSGFGISFMPTRTTIRTDRKPKYVTRIELGLLANEYKKTEAELVLLFNKRKIEVRYDDNDSRRTTDAELIAQEKQRNAKPRKASKRKAASKSQLLEPVTHSRLHEESAVCFGGEVEE